jgi:carboxymethylenebutenolidase
MDISTDHVSIPLTGGGSMGGYLARPEGGGPHPAVLVFMEIFGVNPHIRDVTERVAAEGYVALAPDYFHRTGPGIELGYDDAGMARGMELLGALDADEMISDARDAIAFLRARSDVRGDRIGAMGFCIGGHMTYLTACETDVAAAASFYGGGIAADQGPGGKPSTLGRTGRIRGRILCLFGDQDPYISAEQVAAIRKALAAGGVDHDSVVYPGCGHGWFCDQRADYDEKAAADAWERVKALFAEKLGG